MIENDLCKIRRYNHPAVRDLAWLLASPSLMQVESTRFSSLSDAWFHAQYKEFEDHLTWLDEHPDSLMRQIGNRHRRLGHYAESLIAYWLSTNQRYQLIARNLRIQIRGKTLGELDFIVLDRRTGIQCHWEVAIKFYLGINSANCLADWVGPQRQDCLQHKVSHLFSQQIERSKQSVCQQQLAEQGIEIQQRRIWTKGRLYYAANALSPHTSACRLKKALPFISPQHLQGLWVTVDTLLAWAQNDPYGRIAWSDKTQWLGDLPTETQQLQTLLTGSISNLEKLPRSFVIQWSDQIECMHGFVVQGNH